MSGTMKQFNFCLLRSIHMPIAIYKCNTWNFERRQNSTVNNTFKIKAKLIYIPVPHAPQPSQNCDHEHFTCQVRWLFSHQDLHCLLLSPAVSEALHISTHENASQGHFFMLPTRKASAGLSHPVGETKFRLEDYLAIKLTQPPPWGPRDQTCGSIWFEVWISGLEVWIVPSRGMKKNNF